MKNVPYVIEIARGEHLYETLTTTDSLDISGASGFAVKAPDPLFILSLVAEAGSATDEVILRATANATAFAPLGTYLVEIWATWSSGNPTKTRVATAYLVLTKAADE